jgi:Tol biopolymer transport system component
MYKNQWLLLLVSLVVLSVVNSSQPLYASSTTTSHLLQGSCDASAVVRVISVSSNGIQGNNLPDLQVSISSDGRFTAFSSAASNLVPNDTNNFLDVFVFDNVTCQVERISTTSSGLQSDGPSYAPSISGDGRYIAFISTATNFSDLSLGWRNIYLHDRQTHQTTLISKGFDGTSANEKSSAPAISGNGQYIAFVSMASNIVQGDANNYCSYYSPAIWSNNCSDIFVLDRNTGSVTRASISTSGDEGNSSSEEPSISYDGRYVSFTSKASNLVNDDTNNSCWIDGPGRNCPDIFVHDRETHQTKRVSVRDDGTQSSGSSSTPSISANGRFITFTSYSNDLVSNDTNNEVDIFVHDRVLAQTRRVSLNALGEQGNGSSFWSTISGDGKYVAFVSFASNLVLNDVNQVGDVFTYNRETGEIKLVSAAETGTLAILPSSETGLTYPFISSNGNFVAFYSHATNLVENDSNATADIFLVNWQGVAPPLQPTQIQVLTGIAPTSVILGASIPLTFSVNNASANAVTVKVNVEETSDLASDYNPYLVMMFPHPDGEVPVVFDSLHLPGTSAQFFPVGTPRYLWNAPAQDMCNEIIDPNAASFVVLLEIARERVLDWLLGVAPEGVDKAIETVKQLADIGSDLNDLWEDIELVHALLGTRATANFTITPTIEYENTSFIFEVHGQSRTVEVVVPAHKIREFVGGLAGVILSDPLFDAALNVPGLFPKSIAALLAVQPMIWGCLAVIEAGNINYESSFASVETNTPSLIPGPWNALEDTTPLYPYMSDVADKVENVWSYIRLRDQQVADGVGNDVIEATQQQLVAAMRVANQAYKLFETMLAYDTSGYDYTLFQQVMHESQSSLTEIALDGTNMISNGDFSEPPVGGGPPSPWVVFGLPTSPVWSVNNGVFNFHRTVGSTQGVVYQQTNLAVEAEGVLQAQFELGNSSTARKRVLVLIHDGDFSDSSACTFWLPANTPLRTYEMKLHATEMWTNATISFYVSNPADGLPSLQLDNVSLIQQTGETFKGTRCTDPSVPPPPGGADGVNLLDNADFSQPLNPTSALNAWSYFNQINAQLVGGVAQIYRTGTPRGNLFQEDQTVTSAGVPLEVTFQMGNTESRRMRIVVLIHKRNFGDLGVCTFWLAPNAPMGNYTLRTVATIDWTDGTSLSIYPDTFYNPAPTGRVLVDNVTLRQLPGLDVAGTECYEPGQAVPAGIVVEPEVIIPTLEPTLTPGLPIGELPLLATPTGITSAESGEGGADEGSAGAE